MKKIYLLLTILFTSKVLAQWGMVNTPLATPDIRNIADHPEGYIIAVTNKMEVYRSDTSGNYWNKIATIENKIENLVIDQTGIIYAGTINGYYLSTDAGYTWNKKDLLMLNGRKIHDIEFDANGNIFMVTFGDTYNNETKIYVSTDNGITWKNPTNGLPQIFQILGIEKDSDGRIYLLGIANSNNIKGFISKTTNGGNYWEIISINLEFLRRDFIITPNNIFYYIAKDIYKSEDFGNNWTIVFNNAYSISKLYTDNKGYIYGSLDYPNIASDSGYARGSLIYSSDKGSNWEIIGIGGLKANDFMVSNNVCYIATVNGLRKYLDNYYDWVLCFEYTEQLSAIYDILKINETERTFICSDRGLLYSDNGGDTWVTTSVLEKVNFIRKDNFGNIYTTGKNFYRSTDSGQTWVIPVNVPQNHSKPRDVKNIFINESGEIFTIQNFGSSGLDYLLALTSSDFGKTWERLFYELIAWTVSSYAYSIIENSSILFISYNFKIHQGYTVPGSQDVFIRRKMPNSNWTTIIENKIAHNMYFYNNELYMATSGHNSASLGIIKSNNNGNSFVQLNNGLTNLNVTHLILDKDVFIALTGDGIFRSLNNGLHWVRLNHTGLAGEINSIYYDEHNNFYTCTENGLFIFTGVLPVELISFNATAVTGKINLYWSTATEINNLGFDIERSINNKDWRMIGFIRGNGTTTEVQVYNFSDDLYGVYSDKIYYRLKQIDFNGSYVYSETIEINSVPENYYIYQNYPNPFNPVTTISWQSPVHSLQTLKVFDVLGREVATLVNEIKQPGTYEVEFNAEGLPSGVYYYQLKSGSFIETKKMVVLR